MFHPGQKVVCINTGPSRFGPRTQPRRLRKGAIYTVTHYFYHEISKCPGVLLAEVEPGIGYNAFDASRFAPINRRDTDISEFKKMLNPEKQDA